MGGLISFLFIFAKVVLLEMCSALNEYRKMMVGSVHAPNTMSKI